MKSAANIFGGLLILVGAIWALQGANILPGSIMTGDVKWLVIGVIMIVVGVGLIVWQRRKNNATSDS